MISKKMLLDNTGKDISAKLKKMNYNLITYLKNDNDKSIAELISGNIQEFEDENIINIRQYLFSNCTELTKVNLPKCVNVGPNAFYYCFRLSNVNLPECTNVGDNAFVYCEKLKQFNAPKVTKIENGGLRKCTSLLSVELPECITVSHHAFENCTALSNVNIPKCIELGEWAFGSCDSLEIIELPECMSISSRAFEYCTTLTSVILRSPTVCKLKNTDAFLGTPIKSGNGYIYVPDELIEQYKTATNWSVFANQIKPLSEYTE